MSEIIVNGISREIPKETGGAQERTLLEFLREDLGLTGTKAGCGIGACGSCTVLVDGKPVRSCVTKLIRATGKRVLTIEGLEELQREYGAFRDTLAEITGLDIEFFPVSNRTVAAEALRAGEVDFVLTGPSEYTIISSMTESEPVVAFSRVDYYSVIVTLADSGIAAPADLKGERVAMNDVGSTSGHLGPSQVLADYGLDPVADIETVHTSSEVGFQALKRGDVAAWGNSGLNYRTLRDNDTEMAPGDFRAIARGPDLPNDVLMAGGHVADDVVAPASAKRLHEALAAVGRGKYALTTFLPDVQDGDYDYMRAAFRAIGQDQFAERAAAR